jgi:hypothetical protein
MGKVRSSETAVTAQFYTFDSHRFPALVVHRYTEYDVL